MDDRKLHTVFLGETELRGESQKWQVELNDHSVAWSDGRGKPVLMTDSVVWWVSAGNEGVKNPKSIVCSATVSPLSLSLPLL